MSNFIPADFNLGMAWLADAATPALLKIAYNIEKVVIEKEDRKMLRTLRNKRLLYFSNHPTQAEPNIAWIIGNTIGTRFKSMATRRAFDFGFGLVGKVFQSTGAFSIIPGIADRESMAYARKVLSAPQGKLILFPEGEPMSSENDNLMPFQPGIVKLGLGAMDDARKKDPKADITILPAFIKYVTNASKEVIIKDLENSIAEIASKLGVATKERNLLRKFLMIGRVLTEKEENQLGLKNDSDADWDFRTGRLRHALLDQIAARLLIPKYDKNADAIHKLRFLTAIVELEELKHPQSPLRGISAVDFKWANREIIKAYDFIVMEKDYLVSYPSAERFYEWLARFESLVLGKRPRMLGGEPSHLPRTAFVTFAKPFALSEYYEKYKKDRKATLNEILERLRKDMQAQLEEGMKKTIPIVKAFDVGEI